MDSPLNSFLQCLIFVMILIQVVLTEERITSEYFTAFINISYYDHTRGVLHTERTETGRFSSNPAKEVSGVIVELLSNITNPSDNTTHIIDRSGKCLPIYLFLISKIYFNFFLLYFQEENNIMKLIYYLFPLKQLVPFYLHLQPLSI